MLNRLALVICCVFAAALQSCGGLQYMRTAEPNETRLTAAPEGMALVNFHRPSNYGGSLDYEVFDRTRLIGNTSGTTLFQYSCEPGEHVFIGVADRASAIQADLAAGGVYDVVVNIAPGWMQANITLEAIGAGHPKRSEVSAWEQREQLMLFVDDEDARSRSERRRAWAEKTLADFLGGSHHERLQRLSATDSR